MTTDRQRTRAWRQARRLRQYSPDGKIEWHWSHAELRDERGMWDAGIAVSIAGVCAGLPIRSGDHGCASRSEAQEENTKLARMVAHKLDTEVPPPRG